ncbi:MAG: hypothetical protein J5614_09595 [Paludibacteraceae bacterium]|nr:hypothetical protein [Paludibacteraceae bacterium]
MRKIGPYDVFGFICLEDVTNMREETNVVVYNFELNPSERISEFKRIMEERFSHRFTQEELEATLSYTPQTAVDLIKLIRKYIYGHE